MSSDNILNSKRDGLVSGMSRWNLLSWFVVILVLFPFLIYGIPQIVGAKDALLVRSGSMEPAIPTGSVITIYEPDISALEAGDIITFEHNYNRDDGTKYTTHRIVNVTQVEGEYRFRTKGDANDSPDPGTVTADRIAGIHGFTIPYLGYIIAELDNPIAFLLLVAIPAALLILSEVWNIMKEFSSSSGPSTETGTANIAMFITSFFILAITGAALMGTFPGLFQNLAGDIAFGPTKLGASIMISMLVSMIALKFI